MEGRRRVDNNDARRCCRRASLLVSAERDLGESNAPVPQGFPHATPSIHTALPIIH